MCAAADDCKESRNSEDVTERKIQKDLLWGLYQDARTHARHNETIRSNAVNYMLLGASALIVVITYDKVIGDALDRVLAIILSLIGLIGMVFAASYAELYYRNRAKSGRLLQELDALFFQDQQSINLSDIFPEARTTQARTTDADYEYEGELHEYEYKFKWARHITGKAGSTHVFWILLPFVVFLVGIVLTVWASILAGVMLTVWASILASVIVALIGAYAAYYSETARELNERRAEALTEIRNKASSVCEALQTWAKRVARLPARIPTATNLPKKIEEREIEFGHEVALVLEQRKVVSDEFSSLRNHYLAQKPYLEPKQRDLFDSFAADFNKRYTPLAKYLEERFFSDDAPTAKDVQRGVNAYEQAVRRRASLPGGGVGPINLVRGVWAITIMKNKRTTAKRQQQDEERLSGLPEAAKPAQDWDFQPHLRAFDAEAERLARLASPARSGPSAGGSPPTPPARRRLSRRRLRSS